MCEREEELEGSKLEILLVIFELGSIGNGRVSRTGFVQGF